MLSSRLYFIIAAVLFIPFSIILWVSGPKELNDIAGILIALNITIAIFSINFSFFEYQFSSYKEILGTSIRLHNWLSLALILISLSPLVLLIFFNDIVGIYSLSLLPFIALCSVILSYFVSKESKGFFIIKNKCSIKNFEKYLPKLILRIDGALNERSIGVDEELGSPDHERFITEETYIVTDNDNPLDLSVQICFLAFKNNDLITFELAINNIFGYYTVDSNPYLKKINNKDYKLRVGIEHNINEALKRIMCLMILNDDSNSFIIKLQQLFLSELYKVAKLNKQNEKSSLLFLKLSFEVSIELLNKGLTGYPISFNVAVRRVVQEGMVYNLIPKENGSNDRQFSYTLGFYISYIKRIAQRSIELKNSEYLYQCLDSLGWIGCSAVRNKSRDVLEKVLEALVQIGRECRAKKIKCYSTRCGISPYQHVIERMDWIASWVFTEKQTDNHFFGKELFQAALSRLHGYKTQFNQEKKELIYTKTPYTFEINDSGFKKVLDYSDVEMLEEFELITGEGFFRTPPIPFDLNELYPESDTND